MDIILQRIINELSTQNKRKIDLTNHLGLVNSAFGNWVSGRNRSYTKYIHGIAEFLGVSVEYLRGETDIKEKPPTANGEGLVETAPVNTIRIVGRDGTLEYRRLTDEQIDIVRRMIDQMPDFEG